MFRSELKTERFEPILYLSTKSGTRKILAIGTSLGLTESYQRVDLFDRQGLLSQDITRVGDLAQVFRYGFSTVTGRRAFIRPKVIFQGADFASPVLGEYENIVREKAAVLAGAREVEFKATTDST